MHFESIPMLVRRFDRSDPEDTSFETEMGIPLPFGLRSLYINTEGATFKYQQEEVSREWVANWINKDPKCAFWIHVDGVVCAEGKSTYNSNEKKTTIDVPITFFYTLQASLIYIQDRASLSRKPLRKEVILPPYSENEEEDEDEVEAEDMFGKVHGAVSMLFGNNTRFESGEIVITTLHDQSIFRNVRIINEAHGDHLVRLTEELPPNTKRMNEIELTETVRKRLARDLKSREALPLDISQAEIDAWQTLSDVVDDVDWHMHVR